MWEQSSTFWAERDAWIAGAISRSARRGGGRSLVATGSRWALRADQYLRNMPQLSGWLRMQPKEITQAITEHLATVGPSVMRAYDDALPVVAALAFRAWPVKSGYSKSTMQLYYYEVRPGEFVGGITVGAPYAVLIKNRPHQTLVSAPVRRVTPIILGDILNGMEAANG